MKLITDEELKDAICNNDLSFFKRNIKNIDINHCLKDEDNDTLLFYSISDSYSEIYEFFLANNAKVDFINDEGENILHSAIYSKKLDRVKRVLNEKNINGKSRDGTTPLILSLGLENEEIANYLIDNGACINCADLEESLPIHLASFFGLKQVVYKLLKMGVSLNIKTKKGNLPLALAVNNGHMEVVTALYEEMLYRRS